VAVSSSARKTQAKPLDRAALEQMALNYVGRYATTRARLAGYLTRKLRERGWDGPEAPPVADIVGRMAALGYVDDRAFAEGRALALGRRGYGARRVAEALHAAGIDADDASGAREIAADAAWESALAFARRKRLGPFARARAAEAERQRALQAFARAGHPFEIARILVSSPPGEVPDAPN